MDVDGNGFKRPWDNGNNPLLQYVKYYIKTRVLEYNSNATYVP